MSVAGLAAMGGAAMRGAGVPGAPSPTAEADILAAVNTARPLRGGPIPADIARRLGSAHVGGRYHFTSKPFLVEGAERVHELGLGGIKLWFGNVERGYSFNSEWKLPAAYTMAELARHPYFVAAFALPFSAIALEIFAARRTDGTVDLIHPDYDTAADEAQVYELTRHLLRAYRDREITFLLQNWEGDWMFRGSAREEWMRGEYPQLDARITGFRRWFAARQRGVERARAEVADTRCRVLHAVEVNRVIDSLKGIPTVTTQVLPHIRPDLISWSCYDGLNTGARSADKSAVGIWRGLDLIQHYARTAQQDASGRPAVYIGELGFPENATTGGAAVAMMDGALGALIARQIPYVFYWELYCNERKDGTRPRPVASERAEELRGFWLVRPDASVSAVGHYFSRLLTHAGGRLPS